MANDHYIERCKHGKVLSQCRCHGPKTEYVVECNPELCPAMPTNPTDDVIADLEADIRLQTDDVERHYLERILTALRTARADTRRLDWLNKPGRILTTHANGAYMSVDGKLRNPSRDLRQVIDAAIAAEEG